VAAGDGAGNPYTMLSTIGLILFTAPTMIIGLLLVMIGVAKGEALNNPKDA